ncbi:unnamed protein product [Protopolystoma xenopodis]|uniref:Uncharacterized protein n=1 Tax=Protopolystoma xenopodis TaxID=117903 RepID=A0A448X8F5_9PLAT|nr:unnamed protein product [Protopolystoma xenopodis]
MQSTFILVTKKMPTTSFHHSEASRELALTGAAISIFNTEKASVDTDTTDPVVQARQLAYERGTANIESCSITSSV